MANDRTVVVIVGVLTVDLALFEAQTLKDRRRVILSTKQKLGQRFNVSVAEVGQSEPPKKCTLGIAVVANQSRFVHEQLDKIVDFIRGVNGLTLIDYHRELL